MVHIDAPSGRKRLPAVFYTHPRRCGAGAGVVELPCADRLAIGEDVKDMEFSWPIGMPPCGNMGQGLREVRIDLRSRIARDVFCVFGDQMVLLHELHQEESQDAAR